MITASCGVHLTELKSKFINKFLSCQVGCLVQESILQNTQAKAINMCTVLVEDQDVLSIKIDLAMNVKGILNKY